VLTQCIDYVVGVDTHKLTHTAAVVTRIGAVLGNVTISADAAGHRHLFRFVQKTPSPRLLGWTLGRARVARSGWRSCATWPRVA
jgi:hypothetical protein